MRKMYLSRHIVLFVSKKSVLLLIKGIVCHESSISLVSSLYLPAALFCWPQVSATSIHSTIYRIMCVCVPMPTHCTITCFGFRASHAPLGQITLYLWDEYVYSVLEEVKVRMTVCVTVCIVHILKIFYIRFLYISPVAVCDECGSVAFV